MSQEALLAHFKQFEAQSKLSKRKPPRKRNQIPDPKERFESSVEYIEVSESEHDEADEDYKVEKDETSKKRSRKGLKHTKDNDKVV